MTQATEQKIRERAYEIWMTTGCESGLAELHWLSAEQAVINEAAGPDAMGTGKASARAMKGGKARGAASLPSTVTVRKRGKKDAGRA